MLYLRLVARAVVILLGGIGLVAGVAFAASCITGLGPNACPDFLTLRDEKGEYFPPHELIGSGGIDYALASPDGARVAFLSPYQLEYGQFGVIEDGNRTEVNTIGGRRISVKDFVWMPNSDLILIVFHKRVDPPLAPDRLGILSFDRRTIETEIMLPFAASWTGIAISPDGRRAMVSSASTEENSHTSDLYEVDLVSKKVRAVTNGLHGAPVDPLYVDANNVAMVYAQDGLSRLTIVHTQSGSLAPLTPRDLKVHNLAGVSASGELVFRASPFAADKDEYSQVELDDPIVAAIEPDGGPVQKLFEAGDAFGFRMHPDGLHATAVVDTCKTFILGDCGGGTELWLLDLGHFFR